MASTPTALFKNSLPNEMAPYKYFVSDVSSKSITAIYEKNIVLNKIVIKLNNLITSPIINVSIDGSLISVDGSTSIATNSKGLIELYWTGTAWTKSKWSVMPAFTSAGGVSNYTSFKKITVTQISQTINSSFSSYSNSNFLSDSTRMHLVEVSPRLELDLSDFVKSISINKSLDSKNNFVPISSINADDAIINLSAIPISINNSFVPLFSSQSNLSASILSNMLRKNIKFYINFKLKSYFDATAKSFVQVNGATGALIPGGIYYSDTWDETDIKDVKIQCFDITRYLQTTPVPDYVANLKSVFDVICNILDLAGFTDYDVDSLYSVCNDPSNPLDLAYYYSNSKDTTVVDALAQIFLAYQIGAYIDEYGIMKFKSLAKILSTNYNSLPSDQKMTLTDFNVLTSGYSITNRAKPGKISLRYQTPKIKQSLSLQNASNADIKQSPSFIYTTSNDVVWQQQQLDSVGYNYLYSDMALTDNKFQINQNDLLDIFHTYSLNNDGYAAIENEIVSFVYKEYTISGNGQSTTISIKNDLELSSEINKFIKKNNVGLITSDGSSKYDYDITVTPTGNITNVQRGMFGTIPSAHTRISSLTSKGLTENTVNSSYSINSNGTNTAIVNNKDSNQNNPSVKKIAVTALNNQKTIIYPSSSTDNYYQTYSVKFDLTDQKISASGLFFNQSENNTNGSYFVELIKCVATSSTTNIAGTSGSNIVVPGSISKISTGMQIFGTGIPLGTTVTSVVSADDTLNTPAYLTLSNNLTSAASGASVIGYYSYIIAIYYVSGGTANILSWTDATGTVNSILNNFEKVLVKVNGENDNYTYITAADQAFNLKAVHYYSDGTDGENPGEIIQVFLNNVEINNWQVSSSTSSATPSSGGSGNQFYADWNKFSDNVFATYGSPPSPPTSGHSYKIGYTSQTGLSSSQLLSLIGYPPAGYSSTPGVSDSSTDLTSSWTSTPKNMLTGLRKRINLTNGTASIVNGTTSLNTSGKKFGFYTSTKPISINSVSYPVSISSSVVSANLREIYATQKPLKERSVSYYYQDREFLNGLVQNQNLFSKYKQYIMQTNPSISGINIYDVQYTNPAAVSVDVLPIEYLWYYFPGTQPKDQGFYQKQLVDEYSLSYSTPINTGFRAKMAIANNSSHMIYLSKQSDQVNQFTVNLNLWTHEIIAPSDPNIIEKIVDPANISEVAQVDSPWIQSKQAANKMLSVIAKGFDGFSRDTQLTIFGNPLIQVGDIFVLTYSLAGINQQKYFVHSVSQTFDQGLKTVLVLNMLERGVSY
jgi:hypothetical protein